MRILVVTSSFPRFESDTASVFIGHLCRHVAELGFRIHVLAPDHETCDDRFSLPGVTIHRFHYFFRRWQKLAYGSGVLANLAANRLLLLQIPLFTVSMFLGLIWQGVKQRPDIFHAHWIIPQGLIAVLAGRLLSIPVIVTAHGSDAFALKGKFLAWIKRWTLSHCAAWTSNTRATAIAAQTKAKPPSIPQPFIIPMGIDCGHFAEVRKPIRKQNALSSKHKLLFVGRLVQKKGITDLIDALAILDNKILENMTLSIIGEGNQRAKLERKVHDLGFGGKVKFFGIVSNNDLPDHFTNADIFVSSTLSEGQGIVYLEALASGTPIVATSVGGVMEVLSDRQTALLVPPNQPQAMASAIERLLNDGSLREKLVANGLQHVRRNYDWPIIANRFAKLYRETPN